MSGNDSQVADRIRLVVESLKARHDADDLGNKDDPLDEIIYIVLSSRTRGQVFGKTYDQLRAKYPDWQQLLDAAVPEVALALAGEGLQDKKAAWIHGLLECVASDRGCLDLRFLDDLPTEEAERYLVSLPGVGPKTARCVLMYSLGRPVFPVDANAFRLMQRLGILPPEMTYRQSHDVAQELVPPDLRKDLHVYAVIHGRTVCLPRNPQCEKCVLAPSCDHAQGRSPDRAT